MAYEKLNLPEMKLEVVQSGLCVRKGKPWQALVENSNAC